MNLDVADQPARSLPFQSVQAAALAVLVGVGIGLVTLQLQGLLPGSWSHLANSGAVWALGAFALGAVVASVRVAALSGAAAMLLASCSYYAAADGLDALSSSRGALIWSVAGLVAGPVFGGAGWVVRNCADRRWLALAVVAGVVIFEGVYLVWLVGVDDLWPAGLVELVVGGALAVLCAIRDRQPARILAVVGGGAVAYYVAVVGVDAGFMVPR